MRALLFLGVFFFNSVIYESFAMSERVAEPLIEFKMDAPENQPLLRSKRQDFSHADKKLKALVTKYNGDYKAIREIILRDNPGVKEQKSSYYVYENHKKEPVEKSKSVILYLDTKRFIFTDQYTVRFLVNDSDKIVNSYFWSIIQGL